MLQIIFTVLIIILATLQSAAQSITRPTIGNIGGQFKNGNITLSYTLGEAFVGIQKSGNVQIGAGFWLVVPVSYVSSFTTIYRFTGNGNFTIPSNWEGGAVPPNPLPAGSEIIIAPSVEAVCIVNQLYQLLPGSKISVLSGRRMLVPGNLIIK
jgi:hypothetical protein